MSTTHYVDVGGVHVRGSWNSALDESQPVQAELAVYTKSGQARLAVLDERQLQRLIAECADALSKLRVRREHVEGKLQKPERGHRPTSLT